MNVAELVQLHARHHPDEIALVDYRRGQHRPMTFGQLERAAARVAAILQQHQLRPGDTVLVFHPMSAELYVAIAALLRIGLVAMFIDPSAGRRYIDRCCQLHAPRALIATTAAHWLCWLSPTLRRIPLKFSIGGRLPGITPIDWSKQCGNTAPLQTCPPDSPALISFTTGSHGEPKAALRTHGFLLAQHAAIEQNLGLKPGDVELVSLPIFVLANLASRVTSVIPVGDIRRPEAIAAEPIVEQLQRFHVTRIAAPPPFLERLVDHCESRQIELSALRRVLTGGGPVPPRMLTRLQAVANRAEISVVYGSTEAEPISTVSLGQMATADHAAMNGGQGLLTGHPVPNLQLRILRDQWGRPVGPYRSAEFHDDCQPPGVTGEVVVSGPHVLPGYLYGHGEDNNKFDVDDIRWHRTGDAGYLDAQGRLWLLGRCAARVEDHQGTLYPLGVEHAALQYDYIHRAALVSHRGQRVLAVELAKRSANPDFASLLKSLSFAGVESVRIVKKIPVDSRHNAKTDYHRLRDLLESLS